MYDVSVRPKPSSGNGGVRYLASGVGQARGNVSGSLFFNSIYIHERINYQISRWVSGKCGNIRGELKMFILVPIKMVNCVIQASYIVGIWSMDLD